MPSVTATQVMTDAFQTLNVYMPGDTIGPNDSTTALRFVNLLISQWRQMGLTIPAELRTVSPLQANKGSSTNPYSIGSGGDLNTTKPPSQKSLFGAGLLLNASSPPVEIPRGVMTNDGYNQTRIKDLTSTLFTSVFYLPTFTGDLGQLFLWPVPTDLTNSLVLYTRIGLVSFADATTSYSVPDGYDDALYKNLITETGFAKAFGRTVDAEMLRLAKESLATIKRSNVQLSDLPNDFAAIGMGRGGTRGLYNIQTGE